MMSGFNLQKASKLDFPPSASGNGNFVIVEPIIKAVLVKRYQYRPSGNPLPEGFIFSGSDCPTL